MANPSLIDFVKEALSAGKSRADISKALKQAGWPDDQARGALEQFADVDFPVPVPRPRLYGSAREAFLYVVYFALLGIVAGNIGSLALAWIDLRFADDLVRESWRSGASTLRWAISSLVVGYPIFLYLGWRLTARRRRDPNHQTSRVRIWLTYVTLIFAAATLIGDFVVVVYQFLSGELGARFLAKALVVGVIAGVILVNYVREAERTDARVDWLGRFLAAAATAVAAILVIWGFTIVNSPGAARGQIADERRLTDLATLIRLVDCHRTYFGETPESLEAMSAALSERITAAPIADGCAAEIPGDPSTDVPYRYNRIDDTEYEICVDFERGWRDADLRDMPRRRALQDYRGYSARDGEQRYMELPANPGEACFRFETVAFDTAESD